jgi:hypothetical protein
MAYVRPLRFLAGLGLVAVTLLGACSSSEAPAGPPGAPLQPGDELTYELFSTTKLFDDATTNAVTPPDASGAMHIPSGASALAGVARGDVLLAGVSAKFPHGLLRLVTKVDAAGDGVTVQTIPTPIQMAFRKLHVKGKRRLDDLAGAKSPWNKPDLTPKDVGGAHASEVVDFYLFDGDGNPATTDDQVHIRGELGGGYEYLFGIDVDWGEVMDLPKAVSECVINVVTGSGCSVKDLLPEVKAGLSLTAEAKASLLVEGAAFEGYDGKYTLASITTDPPVIAMGPLVFVIGLDVVAELSGSASSAFSLSTGAGFQAGAELSFSSKSGVIFKPPSESHSFDPPKVQVGLHAKARVQVGPKLSLLLYDVMGPTASLFAFAELAADREKTPCFSAKIGAGVELGLTLGVRIPGYGPVEFGSASKAFDLFSLEAATGSCSAPAGTNTLPPGSGPDADKLLTPSYAPWSKQWSEVPSGFEFQYGALSGTQLTRAIDGRYFAAGANFGALTKIDETGSVLWARKLTDTTHPTETGPEATSLVVRAVAPALDGTVVGATNPYGLVKIGQSGGVVWGERFELATGRSGGPNGSSTEGHALTGITPDGSGGFFVIGTHNAPDPSGGSADQPVRGVVMHVDGDGGVAWSKAYTRAGRFLYPVTIDRLGGALVITGLDVDPVKLDRRTFVLRLDETGAVQTANDLGCTEMPNEPMQPTTALVSHAGNLVVGGFVGSYYRGFLVALKPDGTTAWGAMPWTGSGLSYLHLDSLVELPTTGFVAAGSYVDGYENPQVALLGLDATGKIQWLHRYKPVTVDPGQSEWASLLATDDGGLFTIAHAIVPSASGHGALWAMKPFAKDGSIAFKVGAASVLTPTKADGACTPQLTAVTVTGEALDPKPAPMGLTVEKPSVTGVAQAP